MISPKDKDIIRNMRKGYAGYNGPYTALDMVWFPRSYTASFSKRPVKRIRLLTMISTI
jgi:hypothetical protein